MSDDLDEKQRKERERMDRQAEAAIEPLLRNPEGLRRLRAISDEEWQAAADADRRVSRQRDL